MVNETTKQRLYKQFNDYIKSEGMRQTPERMRVLEKAMEQAVHFDVDDVYQSVIKESRMSLATVYNTIEILCACGILRKHYIQENQAVYELSDDRHIHLICKLCGKMEEIPLPEISSFLEGMPYGNFHPDFISANVYGVCDCCSREIERKEREKTEGKRRVPFDFDEIERRWLG